MRIVLGDNKSLYEGAGELGNVHSARIVTIALCHCLLIFNLVNAKYWAEKYFDIVSDG
jgi:hypothetical protein